MPRYTRKEQAANRAKLVAALRSGKYTQGSGQLRQEAEPERFCCLGVACEISGLGRFEGETNYLTETESSTTKLPEAVRRWLGFTDPFGMLNRGEVIMVEGQGEPKTALTSANDSGATFEQIADAIEDGRVATV